MNIVFICIALIILMIAMTKHKRVMNSFKNISRPNVIFPITQIWTVGMTERELYLQKIKYTLYDEINKKSNDLMNKYPNKKIDKVYGDELLKERELEYEKKERITQEYYQAEKQYELAKLDQEMIISTNDNSPYHLYFTEPVNRKETETTFYIHLKEPLLKNEPILLKFKNLELYGKNIKILNKTYKISKETIRIPNESTAYSIPVTLATSYLLGMYDQMWLIFYYQNMEYELLLSQQEIEKNMLEQRQISFDSANDSIDKLLENITNSQNDMDLPQHDIMQEQLMIDHQDSEDNSIVFKRSYEDSNAIVFKN